MNSPNELTVPKWPFFLADGVFVAAAGIALWFSAEPPGPGTVAFAIILLLLGAVLSLVPYLVEYYWNWQQVMAEREEQIDLQRQALAKTGEEISQTLKRWEEMDKRSPHSEVAAQLKQQLEETARGFEQWQTRLEEKEAKLSAEIEVLFREEKERRQEDRAHFDRFFERLGALPEKTDPPVAESRNRNAVKPVVVEPPAPPAPVDSPKAAPAVAEELVTAEAEAVDHGNGKTEKPPAAPKEKKPAKVKVREESGASLFSTTTLVATAFVGASNKLFLRGEGPGLSWEEGVPMQFVEIGKWSWTTTDATGPIRLQVFKNDEEEDKAGILTVEPGQRLDIRPDFDG